MIPAQMRAVTVTTPGGPEQLTIGEVPTPAPADDEILVRVAATAVNRADTLQRRGKYPPPAGASPILGLEAAGTVVAVGADATPWRVGDEVFGLLPGGGYAEYAAMPAGTALPLPAGWEMTTGAAVPEVFLTAFQALRWLGRLAEGERVLVHAGASGVGTAAIQLARQMGAAVLATASAGKHDLCRRLGASRVIDYQSEDFAEVIGDEGVDLIVDFIMASYFNQNLRALRRDGRLVLLATLGGTRLPDADLRPMLAKRLQIIGSTLRSRTRDYQAALTQDFWTFAQPHFLSGEVAPVVDSVLDWHDAAEAHRRVEANENAGKLVLRVN